MTRRPSPWRDFLVPRSCCSSPSFRVVPAHPKAPLPSVPCTRRRLDSVVDSPPPPVLGFQVGRPGPFSKNGLMGYRPSYGWSLLSKRHPARTASRLIFSRALPVRWGWCDSHFWEDPEEALRPREVKKSQAQGHIDSGWRSWGVAQGPR